jgi:hypothetical protein
VGEAQRAGVEVVEDFTGARLDDFLAVYTHTMQRNNADAWYYFPRSFFQAIVDGLAGHFVFVHALHAGRVVSSDLILYSPEQAYFFLGGTFEEEFPLRPNYLVMHGALACAAAGRSKALVLGGGLTPDDGLFRYKRTFARSGEVPFRVACLTHDEPAYLQLLSHRADFEARQGTAWEPRKGFFPQYRG